MAGILLTVDSTKASNLGLDASWRVSERGSDSQEDNISAYNQRYNLQWGAWATRGISLDANMNYSKNWTSGSGTRENINPSFRTLLQNDLFAMDFNGFVSKTNNSASRDRTSSTWETGLRSNWDYPYWPSLSFSYGQNRQTDSEDIRRTDEDREWYDFTARWELDTLETYYSYYSQSLTNHVAGSVRDQSKHFGRIDYSRSFLGDRGRFSISQQISDSVTDFSAAAGEGENINIEVNLSQGLAGVDQTPERGSLPANPGLIDGNRNTVAFIINLQQNANLGVKTDLQRVDVLYVYTGELDPLIVDETAGLSWDLYTSRDNIDWQRERINPSTIYNRDEFRYEVDVRGTENIYMKLVVTGWPVTFPVPVTEIEAYSTRTGTGGPIEETQTLTRYVTDFNVSYVPTSRTRAYYSLVWDSSDSNPGNDRDRLFQNCGLQWLYNKYFIPALSFSDSVTTNSITTDTHSRSYGLSIRSTPLPTLDTTLSITRNESDEDDEPVSRNHSINLLTSAILYPNLETTLDINVILNKNNAADQSSEAFGIRWDLTGRLRPNLTADLITEYGANTLDFTEITGGEDSGGRTTLDINYRPSDRLSFLLSASQGYGEKWSNYQAFILNTNFSVLRTRKTHVSLGYSINTNQDDTVNNFRCNWSWNISPYLTLQSNANYLMTDEDNIWGVNAYLTARF